MEVESLSWHDYHQLLRFNNISGDQANHFQHSQAFDKNRVAMFISYSILFLVGLGGNAWVACVIGCVLCTSRRKQSSAGIQIYILALCCCDMIVLVFLVFLLLDLAYGRWVVPSNFVCQLYLCSEALNKFCGPFLLMSMSGYCYYTVCWPEKSSSSVSRSNSTRSGNWSLATRSVSRALPGKEIKRTMTFVLACVVSVLILMAPVYFYGGINYLIVHNNSIVKTVLPKCSVQPPENIFALFTIYSFVLGYMLPALLFTYFYSAILYRVHRRRCSSISGDTLYFWRVAKTSMALVLFYLSCWTPYWAMSMYHYFKPHTDSNSYQQRSIVLSYFLHMLPYINCTGYPILYTVINRSIKAAYVQAKEDRRRRNRDRKRGKLEPASQRKLTGEGETPSAFGNETSPIYRTGLRINEDWMGIAKTNNSFNIENILYVEGETTL